MTKQSAAHVRGGVSRARGLAAGGLLHVSPDNRMLQREVEFCPTPVHDGRACAVIAAELVACTLGTRVRPELRLSWVERVDLALDRFHAALNRLGKRPATKQQATP